MKRIVLLLLIFSSLFLEAQIEISGITVDNFNNPVPNVNVIIQNENEYTTTDKDGRFSIKSTNNEGVLLYKHIAYEPKAINFNNKTGFLKVILFPKSNQLDRIVITGTTDYAIERSTPIPTSILKSKSILQNIANKSIPEILNFTPSVYATKSGGGIGDGRINIRGFDQKHVAILLNGIPLNDMENSGMYWSNILGMEDHLSAIQVQRGLGYSKLAISSIGGTINLITSPSTGKKGSSIKFAIGNDNNIKTNISYKSGILKNGISLSFSLGCHSGDGYIKGTSFDAYSYFINLGWNYKSHNLQLLVFGSPQTHGQRPYSHYNMATIEQYLKYGRKYNYNFGYLNGKGYNWYTNYYHKPIASISWDWKVNSKTKLSSSFYTSFGRGGGTLDLGRLPGNHFASSPIFRDYKGLVRFDDIVAYNSGKEVVFSDGKPHKRPPSDSGIYINSYSNNGLTRRAFTNSHTWFGAISNLKTQVSKYVNINMGVDLRKSKGTNYIRLNNLLGADAYLDFFDVNKPQKLVYKTYDTDISSIINVFHNTEKDEKIFFHADGLVNWGGVFGGISYKDTRVSGFLQMVLSNQSFKRKDYYNYLYTDPKRESKWVNILGGNIKSGINFNLDKNNNIYANIGFFSKQPGFKVVFLNHNNDVNQDYKNEKILGVELGYGFKTSNSVIKANVYHTSWRNKFLQVDYQDNNNRGKAKILDLGQNHSGFELEAKYILNKKLVFYGMFSIGDWRYANDVTAKAFDESHKYIGDVNLKLKGVMVPDAAQMTARIAVDYHINTNLKINISQYYADRLFAAISPKDNWKNYDKPLQLPSYSLTDFSAFYRLNLKNKFIKSINFGLNIDNVFDVLYIAESATNYQYSTDNSWRGIDKSNKVFFGFGRTYNIATSISFR